MRMRRNFDHDRGAWVDRGADGRVDDFEMCEICDAMLDIHDEKGEHWHSFDELCGNCKVDFVLEATITDLMGRPRPFNGNIEDRVITNDEFTAEPPAPNRDFMKYFQEDPYYGPPPKDDYLC